MTKLHRRVEGYRVVANRWPLDDGRTASGYPLGPSLQTRYQARKLVARLRCTMSAEWMRERHVGVQQGRIL